jgi:polyether ionophore transport system permease protein
MAAASAVARRTFADGRARTVSFAVLLGLVAYVNVVGFRHSYPTLADRLAFAKSFGANKTVELFYGVPHDLLTVGGYAAWRVGGVGSIIAAAWGALAAVRALRAEEDSGRAELLLAGTLGRRSAYVAALAGVAGGAVVLWLALLAGFAGARLAFGGAAYLALATAAPAVVFAGVGALTSQLAPTRRLALELATGVLVLAFLLRVVADLSTGAGWVRWTTPLGWSEELRPFADPRPAVLLLFVLSGAASFGAAGAIAVRRDVGAGVLQSRDRAAPRLRLLGSPGALALRLERGSLAAWLGGVGAYAVVVGVLSTSFTNSNLPASLRREIRRIGGVSLTDPAGALGFYFLFFVLAISLFACAQVAAVHREEAEGRLETLLSLPVARRRWLAGRIGLAAAAACALALAAAVLAWAGAAAQDAGVSLPRLLEAGANCLPAVALFLGLGALAFAAAPRASTGIAYGLVAAAFLWQLFGAGIGAPDWLLDLSPFRHVGLVPAQPFRAGAAIVMLAIGASASALAAVAFGRRDLSGG